LGSWVWGQIAEFFTLHHALWTAAGCLALSLFIGRGYTVSRSSH
jgi:hypothetical protein